jgi:hypothetical protein
MKIRLPTLLLMTIFLLPAFIHCADEATSSEVSPFPEDQSALNRRLCNACNGFTLINGEYERKGLNPAEIQRLIKAGANVNYVNQQNPSMSLLLYVCLLSSAYCNSQQQLEVATMLLNAKPDLIDKADSLENTPLLLAAEAKASLLCELFVERGADKNKVDLSGRTAFDIANNYLNGKDCAKSGDQSDSFTREIVELLYPYSYPLWMYRTQEYLMNHKTACIVAAAVCVISAAAGMIYRYSSKSETADTDNESDSVQ